MKPTLYVTKADLYNYVSKFEFNEFVCEMRDFRSSTEKRFDSIDRRIDSLEEQFRVQTGLIIEEMREISKATMEYLKHLESKITALETRMTAIESRVTNIELRITSIEDRLVKIGG